MRDILTDLGYKRQIEADYDNFVYPLEINVTVDLPEGFKLLYGAEYPDEENKWSACNLGFHPDLESPDYRNGMTPYISRKNSSMYQDSFECIVVDENSCERNDVCSYCFVYVDKESKTAYIEPVSTREKYRHKGIGTAMMHGVMRRCKEKGIEKTEETTQEATQVEEQASTQQTEETAEIEAVNEPVAEEKPKKTRTRTKKSEVEQC